jgi:hypothetical protein
MNPPMTDLSICSLNSIVPASFPGYQRCHLLFQLPAYRHGCGQRHLAYSPVPSCEVNEVPCCSGEVITPAVAEHQCNEVNGQLLCLIARKGNNCILSLLLGITGLLITAFTSSMAQRRLMFFMSL